MLNREELLKELDEAIKNDWYDEIFRISELLNEGNSKDEFSYIELQN